MTTRTAIRAEAGTSVSVSHALGGLDDERAPAVQHRARLRARALEAARACVAPAGAAAPDVTDLTALAAALCDGDGAPVRR